MTAGARLTTALSRLGEVLPQTQFPLPLGGAEELRGSTAALADQLRDYLLPRASRLDAPLLAVVGGSTGAGKSTLVNSILGRPVTEPGVLRPTTRSPVLICHPRDLAWFESDHVLPGLVRSHTRSRESRALRLVPVEAMWPGLALLDAPDIDSIDGDNRRLAQQLLQAADLWLFVTSAARYADMVGWEVLALAGARDTVISVVLNRCPPEASEDLAAHLSGMLAERGLRPARLFAVAEQALDGDGMVPAAAVAGIRDWLSALAAESTTRADVAVQSLAGSVRSLDPTLGRLAGGARAQAEAVAHLADLARDEFRRAHAAVAGATGDGTMLRGEVLSRWQDFVGTGDFMRGVEQRISWLRDRLTGWFTGAKQADEVQVAISDGLAALVIEAAQAACERTLTGWRQVEWGARLALAEADLARPSHDFETNTARTIRQWQSYVLDLVAEQGRGKRMRARFLALGTNAIGAALIILTFATTGGLTTAEIGIAGGTSLLAQRLLEGVFGEDAVRRLAATAKADLDDRVQGLLATQLARFEAALDALGIDAALPGRLQAVAAELRDAGSAAFDDLTRPVGF